jgi:hypothetical protein
LKKQKTRKPIVVSLRMWQGLQTATQKKKEKAVKKAKVEVAAHKEQEE